MVCASALSVQAKMLMTSIHKICNPKPPKKEKDRKKTQPPHLAAECGLPTYAEGELALLAVSPKLDVPAAVDMLRRAKMINDALMRKAYPAVERSEILWACDPQREKAFLKVRDPRACARASVVCYFSTLSHFETDVEPTHAIS